MAAIAATSAMEMPVVVFISIFLYRTIRLSRLRKKGF